jgi:hypothetical protein
MVILLVELAKILAVNAGTSVHLASLPSQPACLFALRPLPEQYKYIRQTWTKSRAEFSTIEERCYSKYHGAVRATDNVTSASDKRTSLLLKRYN